MLELVEKIIKVVTGKNNFSLIYYIRLIRLIKQNKGTEVGVGG